MPSHKTLSFKLHLPAKTWMAVALAIGMVVAGWSTFIAASQPWMGLRLGLAEGSESQIVVVTAKGPSQHIPVGTEVVALESMKHRIELEPFDLITEPDGLMKDFAEYGRFLLRQNKIAQIKSYGQNNSFDLIAADGTVYPIKPDAEGRPLSSLPPDFWVQVVVGFLAWMVSASVFIFRPRQQNARYLLLSGAATLVFTTAAACYTTRELGFDGETFRWACDINFLGGSLFAASFVALLLYYPRKIAPRWVGIAVVSLFVLWFVLQQLGFFESMVFARRFLVMLGVLATFILAGVQWFVTRKEPLARASLQWFLLSWLLGTSLFAVFILLPQMFGIDTSSIQGYAFSLFLLVYGGLAFGILRFRLFEIGDWWRGILTWTGAVLLLVLLDLLFLYGLKLSTGASLSLSLLISGLLWLPFRAWLWKMITRRKKEGFRAHFDILMAIAANPHGSTAQQEAWQNHLQQEFSALEVTALTDEVNEAGLGRNGLDLLVPGILGQAGIRLSHASEGRRLFHPRDIAETREMRSMLNHILDSLDSYKKGILQERKRIARDVHDNTMGNLLSALHQGETDSKDEKIRNSIRELRQIINDQPVERGDFTSFLATMENECRQRAETGGLALEWQEIGLAEIELDRTAMHAMSSILREALTNILKHAEATRASIELRGREQHLEAVISDNGKGLPPIQGNSGNGLKNMESRLAELGGELSLPESEKGAVIIVSLPLAERS
ncbi:ATP-binding protein [Roseibacillus persicicus]|uniref:sensor histidine kinase n=1 Tax=Roseibacillus persicicus TaxID=454148 RepID=UPI00398A59BD